MSSCSFIVKNCDEPLSNYFSMALFFTFRKRVFSKNSCLVIFFHVWAIPYHWSFFPFFTYFLVSLVPFLTGEDRNNKSFRNTSLHVFIRRLFLFSVFFFFFFFSLEYPNVCLFYFCWAWNQYLQCTICRNTDTFLRVGQNLIQNIYCIYRI